MDDKMVGDWKQWNFFHNNGYSSDDKDTINHPHRQLIINALEKVYPFKEVLEIGCASGPNLLRIKDRWRDVNIYGIDRNIESIMKARENLPGELLLVDNVLTMTFAPFKFDVVLCDALLMYVQPEEIQQAMDKINEITKRTLIICDWDSNSLKGEMKYDHWCRDYRGWMKQYGFEVEEIKIQYEDWSQIGWTLFGKIWIGTR